MNTHKQTINFSTPFLTRNEEKERLIKPKAIIGQPMQVKEEVSHTSLPEREARTIGKLTDSQIDTKDSDDYAYINSLYPGGGKIKVTRLHLNRILKRRQLRRKESVDDEPYTSSRARIEGPMHGSRSRFAKKRPRDQNGRFYTKAELEEMRLQHYKDTILEYIRSHCIATMNPT